MTGDDIAGVLRLYLWNTHYVQDGRSLDFETMDGRCLDFEMVGSLEAALYVSL